ncbi:MAG: hypothetical protein ABR538_06830, partial [Candidatus Binatia bacterium]
RALLLSGSARTSLRRDEQCRVPPPAPFALGGRHSPENIELRCAAHNQYQADLDFGRSFMDARRGNVAAARTFPGECRETQAAW